MTDYRLLITDLRTSYELIITISVIYDQPFMISNS